MKSPRMHVYWGKNAMNRDQLPDRDWVEIYWALELKLRLIEQGFFDSEPTEVERPGSETFKWATHLRRIMAKIGER